MNEAKLIADVRHILDEQELLSGIEWETEDALPISERIKALYPEAMNAVRLILPLSRLKASEMGEVKHEYSTQQGTGRIALPNDYLRLASFKMRGWKRSCRRAIDEGTEEYQFQLNRATRGGVMRPVVAIVNDGTELEYFSLPIGTTPHEIETATYIKQARSISEDEATDESYNLLVWWLAKDVAVTMQRNATGIMETIKTMLSGYGN